MKQLTLQVNEDNAAIITEWLKQHTQALGNDEKGIPINLSYTQAKATAKITLGKKLYLRDIQAIKHLKSLCGEDTVTLGY
jgi:hypothetical protein